MKNLFGKRVGFWSIWGFLFALTTCACSSSDEQSEEQFPATPAGLTATAEDGAVTLSWTANSEKDLSGYNLVWGFGSGDYSGTAFVAAPIVQYRVESLDNGNEYHFAIDAQNQEGFRSLLSAPVSATPKALLRPATPKGFVALAGDGQVRVFWRTTRSPLKAIHILWGTDPENLDHDEEALPSEGEFTISGLANKSTYYFAMEAENEEGLKSRRTMEMAATPLELDVTPPAIKATIPVDLANDVEVEPLVSIAFTEPMDPANFSVSCVPPVGLRTFFWNEDYTEVVFGFSSPLESGTSYTLAVAGKDSIGNSLGQPSQFSFTVALISKIPDVVGSSPPQGLTDFPINGAISVAFTEPMRKDTVQRNIITDPPFNCAFSWDELATLVSCDPSLATSADLSPNTTYTMTIGAEAQSLAGQKLGKEILLVFRTALGPDTTPPQVVSFTPQDNEIGLPLNPELVIAFNEPMDRAWTQAALVIENSEYSPGTFSWNDRGSIMHYQFNWLGYEETPQWKLLGQAKDLAGNPLGTEVSGSFRTLRTGSAMLLTVPELDGNVTSDGQVFTDESFLFVGPVEEDDWDGHGLHRGFMSFDISALPEGIVTFRSSIFKIVYVYRSYWDFLSDTGGVVVEGVVYGPTLDAGDFNVPAGHYYECVNDECGWKPMEYEFPGFTGGDGGRYIVTSATKIIQYAYEDRQALGNLAQIRLRGKNEQGTTHDSEWVMFGTSEVPQGYYLPFIMVSYDYK